MEPVEGFTFEAGDKMIEIHFGFKRNGISGGIYIQGRWRIDWNPLWIQT